MIEVEVKLPVRDREGLSSELRKMGFRVSSRVTESDVYFNHPDRDLHRSDQALRIRTITDRTKGSSHSVVTFKGPKLDRVSVTRPEYETGIADAAVMRQVFEGLGYYALEPVIKERTEYLMDPVAGERTIPSLRRITVCLDQVHGLGDFMEAEILTEREDMREEALAEIGELLGHLGYRPEDTVRTSYLSMLQKKIME